MNDQPNGDPPGLLRYLPGPSRRELLRGAENCRVAAGESLEEANVAAIGIVLDGTVRLFLTDTTGRQQTLRYIVRGGFVGADRVLGVPTRTHAEALTVVRWLRLRAALVTQLTTRDAAITLAVARELAEDHEAALDQLHQASFLHMRNRVVKHLLSRAAVEGDVLHMTQRDVANMVGTVREVAGRVLHELRQNGAVRRIGTGIIEVAPRLLTELDSGQPPAAAPDALDPQQAAERHAT